MPRYNTATPSRAQKPRHTRSFAVALSSQNAAGTEVSDSFSLPGQVCPKRITLNSLVYAYEPSATRYMDTKCALLDAESCLTVPYTSAHSFVNPAGDTPFSVVCWFKTPALITAALPILCHGSEWLLQINGMSEIELVLRSDPDNTLHRTSVETVTADSWVCIIASYTGAKAVENISLSLDGVACTYADNSTGAYMGMADSAASTHIGYNNDMTYAATACFGDLVIFSSSLSSYQQTALFNSGAVKDIDKGCPFAVSRYTFYDHPSDSDTTMTDTIGGHDGVIVGTLTETTDAATSVSNIVPADASGYFLVTLYSVPELRSYTTMAGTSMGQAYSYPATWVLPYAGSNEASTWECYPSEEQGNTIEIENSIALTSCNIRLAFVGSDLTGTGVTVMPRLSWPQAATCRLTVEYEDY